MPRWISAQEIGLIPRQGCSDRLRQLLAGIECVGKVQLRSVALRLGQDFRYQTRSHTRRGPIHNGEVDLVDHQGLIRQAASILCVEGVGKWATRLALRGSLV